MARLGREGLAGKRAMGYVSTPHVVALGGLLRGTHCGNRCLVREDTLQGASGRLLPLFSGRDKLGSGVCGGSRGAGRRCLTRIQVQPEPRDGASSSPHDNPQPAVEQPRQPAQQDAASTPRAQQAGAQGEQTQATMQARGDEVQRLPWVTSYEAMLGAAEQSIQKGSQGWPFGNLPYAAELNQIFRLPVVEILLAVAGHDLPFFSAPHPPPPSPASVSAPLTWRHTT
jgi:hypothetical protein